jgi:uncharacterized membrane protein
MATEHTFLFRRSGSLSRVAARLALGSLAVITLGVGLLFAARGAWLILLFAAAELGALAVAFAAARASATDFDLLRVSDGEVLLTRQRRGRRRTFRCARCWARVSLFPADFRGPASLVLRYRGDAVRFGTFFDARHGVRLAQQLNGLLSTPRISTASLRATAAGRLPMAIPPETDP